MSRKYELEVKVRGLFDGGKLSISLAEQFYDTLLSAPHLLYGFAEGRGSAEYRQDHHGSRGYPNHGCHLHPYGH